MVSPVMERTQERVEQQKIVTWSSTAVDRPLPPAWPGVEWTLVRAVRQGASNFKRWEFRGVKS
jgi:hypothetical protein